MNFNSNFNLFHQLDFQSLSISLQPNTETFFCHNFTLKSENPSFWVTFVFILVQNSPLGRRSQALKLCTQVKRWKRLFFFEAYYGRALRVLEWFVFILRFWFCVFGIDIIVRTFITSQNKQKIWKSVQSSFNHWKSKSLPGWKC